MRLSALRPRAPLIFREAVRLELIMLGVFHPAQKFISSRILEYAERCKFPVSVESDQAGLLCRHQHPCTAHKRDLAWQALIGMNP